MTDTPQKLPYLVEDEIAETEFERLKEQGLRPIRFSDALDLFV